MHVAVVLGIQFAPLANGEHKGKAGIIFNEDCSHFFMTRPAEKMTVEGLHEFIDQYAGTQVSHMFLNVNAQCTSYRSKVWDSIWDDKNLDGGEASESDPWKGWVRNAWLLDKKGIDPYAVWIDRCREKGISPWLSIRMNDVHDNADISHWIHSSFWREHPEYWRVHDKSQKRNFDRAFDYEHEEVRGHYMALVRELLERYNPDGLELDWMRESFCFRPGREQAGREILTKFVRQVDELTESWSAKRAHPIKLAVRVPVHPETARGFGLDAVAWAKAGLIDILVPSPRWQTADFDIPIELWRELLGRAAHKVTVAACLEVRIKSSFRGSPSESMIKGTAETAYGFSAAMLDRGADQIYLFNYFDSGQSIGGPDEYRAALSNAGELDTVVGKPRRHIVTWRDRMPPGVPMAHLLPADLRTGSSGQFRIYAGPKPATGQVIIRVGLREAADANKVVLAARMNSLPCKTLEDHKSPKLFHSFRVAQFEAPLDIVQRGYNLVEIFHEGGGGNQRIVWLELYITP